MDQGVIEAFKRRFRKIMLQSLLEADCSLKEFWKAWSIKDAIYACAESWNDVQNVTLQRSWFKLWPELKDTLNCTGTERNMEQSTELLNAVHNVVEFENVTVADIEEWLNSDRDQPGYQVLNDTEIASTSRSTNVQEQTSEEDTDDDDETDSVEKISAQNALSHANSLLNYLGQQNDIDYIDVLSLRKIRTYICFKMHNSEKRQTQITDFF